MVTRQRLTLEEFVVFVHQPENLNREFELINGEMIEMSPSRSGYSGIGAKILARLSDYCEKNNLPENITMADGTFDINGNVLVPDVAYKSTPLEFEQYPDPIPPQLVVEVISPNDKATEIREKRQVYIDAGILYWEVYYTGKRVDVYAPGQPMRSLSIDDEVDGGDVLPGFKLSVGAMFR